MLQSPTKPAMGPLITFYRSCDTPLHPFSPAHSQVDSPLNCMSFRGSNRERTLSVKRDKAEAGPITLSSSLCRIHIRFAVSFVKTPDFPWMRQFC
ncbi:hypothetical protein BaRGS_00012086 [Batillaria attramentaria]|uniref:Uncharacterized protein n=1 Tax=Batillaria attramentaria TaxID=370345 RepID=A0ABD0JUC0_9CAEN